MMWKDAQRLASATGSYASEMLRASEMELALAVEGARCMRARGGVWGRWTRGRRDGAEARMVLV